MKSFKKNIMVSMMMMLLTLCAYSAHDEEVIKEEKCVICLENFDINDEMKILKTDCCKKNLIHNECFFNLLNHSESNWQKADCPNCRGYNPAKTKLKSLQLLTEKFKFALAKKKAKEMPEKVRGPKQYLIDNSAIIIRQIEIIEDSSNIQNEEEYLSEKEITLQIGFEFKFVARQNFAKNLYRYDDGSVAVYFMIVDGQLVIL